MSVGSGPGPSRSMWDEGEDITVEVNQRALIDKILARYSGDFTIFRELLQNADDAGAKRVQIRFETEKATSNSPSTPGTTDLPDLKKDKISRYVFLNDGVPFRDQDWLRLRKIAEGNPDDDKIGAFGVGFYALFSITESPLVESGSKWMGFYWKDGKDQLFARSGNLPTDRQAAMPEPIESLPNAGSGHPWTTFTMGLREPAPMERPLEFSRFLVTSLTFMANIRHIELRIDHHKALEISKDVGVTERLDVSPFSRQRGAAGPKSPQGVMTVNGVDVTAVKMQAKIMRWLNDSGFAPPPLPPARPMESLKSSGFAAMLQSALFSRSTPPAPAPKVDASAVTKDRLEILSQDTALRIFAADVLVNVDRNLGKELERATKKPPPKRTKLQLIYSPMDDPAIKQSEGREIFSGLKADLNGERTAKIFIGQATAQTTGIAGHIAARFIPTVERESIDLQDRYVSVWNKELLYVGGYISRVIYETEMADIKGLWPSATEGASSASEWLEARSLHLLRFFAFHASTPSSLVSRTMEAAFFGSFGTRAFPIISSRGVLTADIVRIPHTALKKFLPNLPVIPDNVAEKADLMVARLRERGLLLDVSLDDVVRELSRSPLNDDQMIACLEWWSSLTRMKEYDVSLRARLINAAVLVSADERVVPLSEIKTYLNPQVIPADLPLPPTTFPYSVSKRLNVNDLRFNFDWSELTTAEWVRFIVESKKITDVGFSDTVFGVLSRAWPRINQAQKDEISSSLNSIACVPTRVGARTPKESYFSDVDLFPDLAVVDFPSLQIKGQVRNTLAALGVRSHVDLQLVFSRLVGSSKWSCCELIRYLVSIKSALTEHEMARLMKTAAFPVAPKPGEDTSNGTSRRVTPDKLYEPTAEHVLLGVDVLDWGAQWKPNSAEATFAYSLGLRRHIDVSDLVERAAHATNTQLRERALRYLVSNISHYRGFSALQYPDKAFIPAVDQQGHEFLAKPTEAFLNPAACVMGFAIVAPMENDGPSKLKLLKDVPTSKLVHALKMRPPETIDTAIKYFEYLASRLADFYQERTLKDMTDIAFIRLLDERASPSKSILARPSEVFLKPATSDETSTLYDVYKRVFLFVDMGRTANSFLEACGVKRQPSIEQLAQSIVEDPQQFLRLAQTKDMYLAQLRILAASYSNLPVEIKRTMVKSRFLLAGQRVPSSLHDESDLKGQQVGNINDEEEFGEIEWDLATAQEICIVDDPNAYGLFGLDVKAAPQETLLEDFYSRLGSQPLSTLIKEEYNITGVPAGNTDSAVKLRRLIIERLALFLADRQKSSTDVSLDWLKKDGNFSVLEVNGLRLKRTLRQSKLERSNIQSISAASTKGRGGVVNLYISREVELDMYEVALALTKVLFKHTRPEEPLLLMTILNTPLAALKRRGYNVDRILQSQRAERLAREAHAQEQRAAAEREVRERMLSPQAKAAALAELQETENHLANATNAVLEKGIESSSTSDQLSSQGQPRNSTGPSASSNRLSKGSFLDTLRGKFRSGGTGLGHESKISPGTSSSAGSKAGNESTSVGDNAIRAVAASRPNTYKDIVSDTQRQTVRESDAYCDTTGVKTNLTAGGVVGGVEVFIDKGIPDPDTLLTQQKLGLQRFAKSVVLPICRVFELSPASVHIFYDLAGPLIAFNRGGGIFLNARYYLAWHDGQVASGNAQDALISWWLSTAHELAHNMVSAHSSEHEFYVQAICETYLMRFVEMMLGAAAQQ